MNLRRSARVFLALLVTVGVTLTCAGSAGAAQPDRGSPMAAAAAALAADGPLGAGGSYPVTVDVAASKGWPAELMWAIPNTAQYKAKYPATARPGCGVGTDVASYEQNFMENAGSIFGAVAKITTQGVFADFTGSTSGGGPATVPFAAFDASKGFVLSHDSTTYDPGEIQPYLSTAAADQPATSHIAPCAKDFKPYGTASTSSAFGFSFYPNPDQASVDDLIAKGKTLMRAPANKSAADFWSGGADWESADDFKVTDTQHYCTDNLNPFCATAMFLHCPASLPKDTTSAAAAAIYNCRIWNENMLVLNAMLKAQVEEQGKAAGSALHEWAVLMVAGRQQATALHVTIVLGLVALGVAVFAGSLALGAGLLLALGITAAYAVTVSGNWDKVWGVVSCAADFGKCMAEEAAKGMAVSTGLVSKAAKGASEPDLATSSATFNSLAGISAVLTIILFLLALLFAAVTGKLGLIIPATVGLGKWGVTIGAGSTILTLIFGLSGSVADSIAGAGSSSNDSLGGLADSLSTGAMNLGGDPVLGWLLVAFVCLVGMVSAVIVFVVVSISNEFIPLAISLMILQASGFTGPAAFQKWIHRGWGMLWMIILLRPAITLIAKNASNAANQGTLGGFIGAVSLLLLAAVAPWLVVQMFPVVAAGGLGVMRGLFSAAQGLQAAGGLGKSIGAAAKGGVSRATSLAQTLSGSAGSKVPSPPPKAAPGGGSGSAGSSGSSGSAGAGTGGNTGRGKFGGDSAGSSSGTGIVPVVAATRPGKSMVGNTPSPAEAGGSAGPDSASTDGGVGHSTAPAALVGVGGVDRPPGPDPAAQWREPPGGAAPQVGNPTDVASAPRVAGTTGVGSTSPADAGKPGGKPAGAGNYAPQTAGRSQAAGAPGARPAASGAASPGRPAGSSSGSAPDGSGAAPVRTPAAAAVPPAALLPPGAAPSGQPPAERPGAGTHSPGGGGGDGGPSAPAVPPSAAPRPPATPPAAPAPAAPAGRPAAPTPQQPPRPPSAAPQPPGNNPSAPPRFTPPPGGGGRTPPGPPPRQPRRPDNGTTNRNEGK
ncbi:hypothetical protein ABIB25_000950 [Nakamurella sp. UYEF19]|uniref:hypothetical protein n=1 Tax=Nakamurella sp. UYEF19 TaxID=1756392 RepID=UPI00339601B5